MQSHTKTGTENAGSFFAAGIIVFFFPGSVALYSFFEYIS